MATNKKKGKQIPHILVRIKSEDGKTISDHRAVIQDRGRVLFAKIGRGLGQSFVKRLNDQIDNGVPTYLFLGVHEGWNQPFGFYQCELLSVRSELDKETKIFVPGYLEKMIPDVETWFEIKTISRLSRKDAIRIFVLSSGREIMSAIRGQTAVFKVGVKGEAAMEFASDPAPVVKKAGPLDSLDDSDNVIDDNVFVEDWISHRKN